MLIHALLDNKPNLGNGLTYQLYNGYFNGTDATPNLSWFNTAELLATGVTSNLTSLATATNNTFQQNFNDTEAMNDNWNMSGYTYVGTFLTITSRTNNNIRLTMNGQNDPQLELAGTSRPTVNSNNFKYIHLRYKLVSGTANNLEIFYYNTTGQNVDQSRAVSINYGVTTIGQWQNIVIDMSTTPNWTSGNWNRFRIDPIFSGTAVIDFEYFVISNSIQAPDYNNKSVRLSGAFRAKKTGMYRFFTRSDDASFFYIDNIPVVSNGGTHNAQNRFGNYSMTAGNYYPIVIYYGDGSADHELSAGFLEPRDDGTTSGSTNLNDFIKDGTGLDVYFLTNWSNGGGNTSVNTLVYNNASLYGRYKISLIGLYVDRPNFTSGKNNLLFISSPQLYVPCSGSRLLVLHEEPVSSDFAVKDYHIFSDEFEIDAELNGIIELTFQRGDEFGTPFQRALLVMQADKI